MEGNGVMDGDGHGNMNGVGSMERDVNMDGDGLGVGGMDEDMGVGLGTWGMKLELEMGSCSVLAHPRAPNVPLLGTPPGGDAPERSSSCNMVHGGRGIFSPAQWGFRGAVAVVQVASYEQTLRDAERELWLHPITTKSWLQGWNPQRDLSTPAACGVSRDPESFGGRGVNYHRAAINPSSRNLRWL